ncbi:MAG: apurinic endonuclease Apn1 [Thermoleophilia bacterium]|nr:apurinic endonuclease Apn1 [Thermoleophilia bacterium]
MAPYDPTMYFGSHVSSSGGIDKAVERAIDLGADAVQMFIQSPRMWRPVNHKDENIARFRELRDEHLQGAVAHAIYLINVASDDPEIWEKGATALAHTMTIGARLGLDGVIFHPGSHKGAETGLAGCVDLIAKACLRAIDAGEREAAAAGTSTPYLLLENTAGTGGTIGRDAEELATLVHATDDHGQLGVCIDSCHWWASGVDVTDREALDRELAILDDAIGPERLRAIHLNDSKTPLGSNRDRHDNIGEGLIGDGLGTFLAHPRFEGLGAYLEVPGTGDGTRPEDITAARTLRERALARA